MSGRITRRGWLFFASCCAVFAVPAIYLNTYGPDAPLMMAWYQVDAAEQGLLVTLQSVGGCATAVFLALKGEQFSKIRGLGVGLAVLGAGCLLMGLAPSFRWLLALAVLSGIGFTIVDVLVNGVLADVFPEHTNTLIPVGHAFYGAGAMAAPLVVTALVSVDDSRTFSIPFTVSGMVCFVLLILYALAARHVAPGVPEARRQAAASGSPGEIFREKSSWILLGAGVLYFSFQMGVSSWLPTFCLEEGIPYDVSGLMLTCFFGGALIMSFLSALLLRILTARQLFGYFGLASAALMTAALLQTDPAALMWLTGLSGFCQGVGVITLILVAVDAFPHRSASASSIQVTSANIGAITAPLWVGALSDLTGFRFPLLLTCAMYAAGSLLVLFFAPQPAPGRVARAS